MSKGAKIGVFHLGLQHSWQTALAFQESAQLAWFATSIFYSPDAWPYRAERYLPSALKAKVGPELRRRASPLLDTSNLRLFGLTEWAEVMLRRSGLSRGGRVMMDFSRTYFSRQVIKLLQREPVDVVWGYNGFARDVFRWAKPRGVRCVLDQTIGHYRSQNQMLRHECERFPEFFASGITPFSEEFISYQEEELELADVIIVGSDFVARTLVENGVSSAKIVVQKYGFEETEFPVPRVRTRRAHDPARFLFLGQIHPRKGVHYLLEAFSQIPASKAELTLVGSIQIPAEVLSRYAGRVKIIPHVPRHAVPAMMAEQDCFVFPSLFEGSALVLYEAIGSGMGRIYTPMSGHSSPDGDGILLDHVTAEALRDAVLRACDDPGRIEQWSRRAAERRPDFTWGAYRAGIRDLVAGAG